jgi:hypothetical protein
MISVTKKIQFGGWNKRRFKEIRNEIKRFFDFDCEK